MRPLPTSADHVTEIAFIHALATNLLDLERKLRARHHVDSRDGYPTRSLGGGGRGGGHSDPVLDLIVSREHGGDDDPLYEALRQTLRLTREARKLLERAESEARSVLVPPAVPDPPVCVSCLKAGITNEAIYRAGRCRNCYGWLRAHRIDPKPEICRTWADGRYVTPKLVETIYGPSGVNSGTTG